jgi:hypothetical protein
MHRGCIGKSPGGAPRRVRHAAAAPVPPPLRFRRPALPPRRHALCFPLPNDFFAILSPAIATTGICDSEEKLLKLRLINNDIDSRHIRRRTSLFAGAQRSHSQAAGHLWVSAKTYVRVLYARALPDEVPCDEPAKGRRRPEVCLMTGWGWRNDGANVGRA